MDDYIYWMFDQPGIYAFILLFVTVVYFFLGRKTSVGWLDPWMPQQFLTACATTTVLFLWWIGKISMGMAIYHIVATAIFYLAASHDTPLQRARRRAKVQRDHWRISTAQTARLQLWVFLILLISQLAMWSSTGLPVLLPSRLDASSAGGGVGAFVRIAAVFSPIVIFLTVMRIGLRGPKYSYRRDAVILALILMIQVGNGSKSSIIFTVLFFITSDWMCRQVSTKYLPIALSKRKILTYTLIVTAFALVPLAIDNLLYNTEATEGAIVQFVARVLLSGDSYIHFLVDGKINGFVQTSPTLLLAGDLLGTLRFVPRESLPLHPGILLYRDLFPYLESVKGPNMRFDLFGLLYGGWWQGLVFVAVLGAVFNFARSSLFMSRTPSTIMLSAYLFLNAPAIFIDPTIGEGVLFNAAISFPILYVLCVLAKPRRRPTAAVRNASRHPPDPNSATVPSHGG